MPLSVAYFTIVQLLLSARNTYASDSEHPKFSAFHFDVLPGRILVFLANASNDVKQTTTNALNQPDCVEGCIDTPWCRSVNLKAKDRNKGLHLCELLSVDKFNNGRYLKADQEFTHYSLKVRWNNFFIILSLSLKIILQYQYRGLYQSLGNRLEKFAYFMKLSAYYAV